MEGRSPVGFFRADFQSSLQGHFAQVGKESTPNEKGTAAPKLILLMPKATLDGESGRRIRPPPEQ